jgi:Alpha/beta-hydrolase family
VSVRHPWPAVLAWSTAVATVGTPWLLEPPLWVRLVSGALAFLSTWGLARALGGLGALVLAVVQGRARSPRLAVGLAATLVLTGCAGTPSPASSSAEGAAARAAVTALVRSGGLSRSTVLVAVPTGSGWVDEGAVRSLEELTGGDLATVTVQYAAHPSWVEYLLGTDRAERSATALLGAVRAQIDELPAAQRPRLLIFGESLGATAAAAAVQEVGGVDGCLLVGRPGSGGGSPLPGCTDVRNDDDPVPWWRPGLAMTPRAGLPWLPVATFWQLTGSLVTSLDHPLGHGHRYGETLADDWAALDVPTGDDVRSQLRHRPGDGPLSVRARQQRPDGVPRGRRKGRERPCGCCPPAGVRWGDLLPLGGDRWAVRASGGDPPWRRRG